MMTGCLLICDFGWVGTKMDFPNLFAKTKIDFLEDLEQMRRQHLYKMLIPRVVGNIKIITCESDFFLHVVFISLKN